MSEQLRNMSVDIVIETDVRTIRMNREFTDPNEAREVLAELLMRMSQLGRGMTAAVAYRLTLPYEGIPKALHGNTRAGWRQRVKDTRMVRDDVMRIAQRAGLHRLDLTCKHVTVELVWAPGDNRRRDSDNLWPLLKVACDALAKGPQRDLVGLELVPDDTPAYMTKLPPRLEPPPAKGMWLDLLLDLEPVDGAA